jgi:hypothetical protein
VGRTGKGGLSVQEVTEERGEPIESTEEDGMRGGNWGTGGAVPLPPLLSLSPRTSPARQHKHNHKPHTHISTVYITT